MSLCQLNLQLDLLELRLRCCSLSLARCLSRVPAEHFHRSTATPVLLVRFLVPKIVKHLVGSCSFEQKKWPQDKSCLPCSGAVSSAFPPYTMLIPTYTKMDEPDRPFQNFRTLRQGDLRNVCSSDFEASEL